MEIKKGEVLVCKSGRFDDVFRCFTGVDAPLLSSKKNTRDEFPNLHDALERVENQREEAREKGLEDMVWELNQAHASIQEHENLLLEYTPTEFLKEREVK